MKTGNWIQMTGKRDFGLMLMLLLVSSIAFEAPASGLLSTVSGIKIENGYVRPAAKGMMSAAYFKISNFSFEPDTLYAVRAEFAKMAQLHESFRKNGMVGMKEIGFVVIPAKGSVVFKPGGYHVMLMDVKEDLKTGIKVKFSLVFKHAGEVEVIAPVK